MSVLIVDRSGLAAHARETLTFCDEETLAAATPRLIAFWEKEVARRTGPTYYLPLDEKFLPTLEAVYRNTEENIICLGTLHHAAAVDCSLDYYTPGPEFFSVERWTSAAAKRVCGCDPRWYSEYLQCGDKRQARKLYDDRWIFLRAFRQPTLTAGDIAERTPGRLLNVEGALYTSVQTEEELAELVDILSRSRRFSFDDETTGLHPIDSDLVGASFCVEPGRAYYVPVGHVEGDQLPLWRVMEELQPVFGNPEIGKIGHKIPFDINHIETHADVYVKPIAGDTKTLAWMLGYGSSGAHMRYDQMGLKQLAYMKLGIKMMDFATTVSGKDNAAYVPIDKMTPYAAADADMTHRLHPILLKELEAWGPKYVERYYNIELPFLRTVANMERRGVYVNTAKVQEIGNEYARERWQIEEELKGVTQSETFNPNSGAQVGNYLFKQLGLPALGGRTKTGYKTDQKTLEQLRVQHPAVDMILEWRALSKLIGTYTEALPRQVSKVTGRVHGLISTTGTATGRVSMSDPNLMNVPTRTERGARLRYAFEGQDDNYLLDIDYSQVEPRVLAHLSEDPFLIDTFCSGVDLYRAIAGHRKVFNCAPEDVTSKQRSAIKMAWLAATYLVGAKKLADQLTVQLKERWTTQQAADFLAAFFSVVSRVKEFQDAAIAFARYHGYVETMLGFRIPVAGIDSPVPEIKAHAHSQAVNLPIQGTASGDIVKLAMNQLDALGSAIPPMILQIHDELIFEGPREQLEAAKDTIQIVMENVVRLRVPLEAKPKIAKTWGEAKED